MKLTIKKIKKKISTLAKGGPIIKNKKYFLFGEDVTFGKNVRIYAQGGVIIGDGVQIGDHVQIGTPEKNENISSFDDLRAKYQPIILGSNLKIESKSLIKPSTINIPENQNRNNYRRKPIYSCRKNIFFVLSTGRAGSRGISRIINKSNNIKSAHEGFPTTISISTKFAHGEISENNLMAILSFLYKEISLLEPHIRYYGESDQKLSFLIPQINKVFPEAKFIWLIREPSAFVASSYARGWFDDWEFGYSRQRGTHYDANKRSNTIHALNRINGYLAGEMSESSWRSMTSFERNCWYWSYCNGTIEKELSKIDHNRWIQIKTKDLNDSRMIENLLQFLSFFPNRENFTFSQKRYNKADYRRHTKKNWTSDQKNEFEKWTIPLYTKYFRDH
ncbi:MAG: hypothetical protein AAF741_03695 [Bacteroidota bacterium]